MINIRIPNLDHMQLFHLISHLSDKECANLGVQEKYDTPLKHSLFTSSMQKTLDSIYTLSENISITTDTCMDFPKELHESMRQSVGKAILPIGSLVDVTFSLDVNSFTKQKRNFLYALTHSSMVDQKLMLSNIDLVENSKPKTVSFRRTIDLGALLPIAQSPFFTVELDQVRPASYLLSTRLQEAIHEPECKNLLRLYQTIFGYFDNYQDAQPYLCRGYDYHVTLHVMESEVNNVSKLYPHIMSFVNMNHYTERE